MKQIRGIKHYRKIINSRVVYKLRLEKIYRTYFLSLMSLIWITTLKTAETRSTLYLKAHHDVHYSAISIHKHLISRNINLPLKARENIHTCHYGVRKLLNIDKKNLRKRNKKHTLLRDRKDIPNVCRYGSHDIVTCIHKTLISRNTKHTLLKRQRKQS